ncbi:putative lipo domain protein [Escherichia coli]|nr:putative lipo domain protein [Escherichia coli]
MGTGSERGHHKSNANVPVTVTVALADDLTGREKHEVALNRPPRVTKTYSLGR